MRDPDNEFHAREDAERLASAAAAGELIFGESLDADEVLPPGETPPRSAPDRLT